VDSKIVPWATLVLACAWCLAQALPSGAMAAAVAVAAIWLTAALALRRRPPRRLARALAAMMAVLSGGLMALLLMPGTGSLAVLIQLALVLVLAPAAPAIYAATFSDHDDEEPGQ
jgi:hypothetical protein